MTGPEKSSPLLGPTTGFDLLRLTLALLILWSHSSWIQQLTAFNPIHQNLAAAPIDAPQFRSLFRTTTAMAVPMFFVLSGYLVAGSAERLRDLRIFLIHRLLRIVPALLVEVTLSAVVIGCLFTKLPLREYFARTSFYEYFLNVVGIVHFYLPGVFEDNILPRYVNINLWTLPAEFYCYLLMSICVLVNFRKYRHILLYVTVCVYVLFIFFHFLGDLPITNGENFDVSFVVIFFFIGVCFYLYRSDVTMNFWIFIGAFTVGFGFLSYFPTLIFSPALISYATVYIGTRNPYLPAFFKKNDYSYGIYLYGFPIAQSLSAAFPQLREMRFTFRFAAVALTVLFAALSWHLVERRFLALKSRLAAPSVRPAAASDPEVARSRDRIEAARARSGVRFS